MHIDCVVIIKPLLSRCVICCVGFCIDVGFKCIHILFLCKVCMMLLKNMLKRLCFLNKVFILSSFYKCQSICNTLRVKASILCHVYEWVYQVQPFFNLHCINLNVKGSFFECTVYMCYMIIHLLILNNILHFCFNKITLI